MSASSCQLTIFEGPDGSGKSTAARVFAEATGARYVHFGRLPHVSAGLARLYVEAMLPALLGYQPVVLDRCWLSEAPYGLAFRSGADRLGTTHVRMLERLAMRCGATVIRCLPPWEEVARNYQQRRGQEYPTSEAGLRQVYDHYATHCSGLPELLYDYTAQTIDQLLELQLLVLSFPTHPLALATAGSWWPRRAVLVGETFAERKDLDPWYQWPFASFSQGGCSQWLAAQLEEADVPELDLLWVNADQPLEFLHGTSKLVVALGAVAAEALSRLQIECSVVAHPQAWKRFQNKHRYPLLDLLASQEIPRAQ